MEQHKALGRGIDQGIAGIRGNAMELKGGLAEILVIPEKKLPDYLSAASLTGFTVIEIAREGEEYPVLSWDQKTGKPTPNVVSYVPGFGRQVCTIRVLGKDNIAVSIRRPKGHPDFTPFWKNLENFEQDKTQPPSNPTANS